MIELLSYQGVPYPLGNCDNTKMNPIIQEMQTCELHWGRELPGKMFLLVEDSSLWAVINEAARILSFLQLTLRNHLPISRDLAGFCSVRVYIFTPEILLKGLSPVHDAFTLQHLFFMSLTESFEVNRKLSLLLRPLKSPF